VATVKKPMPTASKIASSILISYVGRRPVSKPPGNPSCSKDAAIAGPRVQLSDQVIAGAVKEDHA
jgi:hypothetical protein